MGDLCKFIGSTTVQVWEMLIAILSLILFNVAIIWQISLRFDFTRTLDSGIIKKSNWIGVSILIYCFANEIGYRGSGVGSTGALVIMNIGIVLHCLIFFIKKEHEDETPMKIEFIFIMLNLLAIAMVDIMTLVSIHLNIVLWLLVSLILSIAIFQY